MSIKPIGSVYANLGIMPGSDRTKSSGESQVSRPQRTGVEPRPTEAPPRSEAVPAETPAGTDPQLWAVLSSDERAFFARARALGPLTYAPGRPADRQSAAPVRGGRVDLKV